MVELEHIVVMAALEGPSGHKLNEMLGVGGARVKLSVITGHQGGVFEWFLMSVAVESCIVSVLGGRGSPLHHVSLYHT